jgi:DNA-binding transcriptional MerR regulator
VRYRVEQLAGACDVSVDTVRYYQSRGLLPAPEREGRVAWYGPQHVAAIDRIRSLQAKGLTLQAIGRVLGGGSRKADADLAAAVAEELGADGEPAELLTLEAFSEASGVPASLIQAVEREGIRIGRTDGDGDGDRGGATRYTRGDIEFVRTALRLLEYGLPLRDLLLLAREADAALRSLAEDAVDLFNRHVRVPIRDSAGDDAGAAAQMVEAFHDLLPTVTSLVSQHFRRVVLEIAEERIES